MASKKTKPEASETKQSIPISGVWGLAMIFVIVSITFSAYIILVGTEGIMAKVLIAPQIIFATVVSLIKFIK